jgi:hypothetical protein
MTIEEMSMPTPESDKLRYPLMGNRDALFLSECRRMERERNKLKERLIRAEECISGYVNDEQTYGGTIPQIYKTMNAENAELRGKLAGCEEENARSQELLSDFIRDKRVIGELLGLEEPSALILAFQMERVRQLQDWYKLAKAECEALAAKLAGMEEENARLRKAAQAVIERWETPTWKEAEPTAAVIYRLRDVLLPKNTSAKGEGNNALLMRLVDQRDTLAAENARLRDCLALPLIRDGNNF